MSSLKLLHGYQSLQGEKFASLHFPKTLHFLAERYGPVCGLHLGPVPTIIISDAELLREAFKRDSLTAFRPNMKPFHEFRYGDSDGASQRGVILSSGSEWVEQRRFCMKNLKDLGMGKSSLEPEIAEEVTKLCEKWYRVGLRGEVAIDLTFRYICTFLIFRFR